MEPIMHKPVLSVALCCCNGEKYIEQQLRSIIEQELPVDEIIVSDDRSIDSTLEVVRSVAQETNIAIRILTNDTAQNYGVCANFEKAIAATRGDVIFFSDQDDVWLSNKTKVITSWFSANPTKEMVFSNAWLIDDDGRPFLNSEGAPLSIVDNLQTDAKQLELLCQSRYMLEAFLNGNIYTGAMIAVRRSLVNKVPLLQLGEGKLHHDAIVALLAIDKQSVIFCPTPTIYYRIHRGQVCGMPIHNSPHAVRSFRQFLPAQGSYLTGVDYDKWPISANAKRRIAFYEDRIKMERNISVLLHLFKYLMVYNNIYIYILDTQFSIKQYLNRIIRFFRKRIGV